MKIILDPSQTTETFSFLLEDESRDTRHEETEMKEWLLSAGALWRVWESNVEQRHHKQM